MKEKKQVYGYIALALSQLSIVCLTVGGIKVVLAGWSVILSTGNSGGLDLIFERIGAFGFGCILVAAIAGAAGMVLKSHVIQGQDY